MNEFCQPVGCEIDHLIAELLDVDEIEFGDIRSHAYLSLLFHLQTSHNSPISCKRMVSLSGKTRNTIANQTCELYPIRPPSLPEIFFSPVKKI